MKNAEGSAKWEKTRFPGVRFREHPTRKHNGQPDKYFVIRYKVAGKPKEEALGWGSDGWNAQKSSLERAKLKSAHVTGEGAQTLTEKRQQAQDKKEAELTEKSRLEKENLSFGQYFTETYFPNAQENKTPWSWKREQSLFKLWISPAIALMPLKDIRPIHLERIKKDMSDAGKSSRSIRYALAVVRQVFNFSIRNGAFQGSAPTVAVRQPQKDNQRVRFLTHQEAATLLDVLKDRSLELYQMALLSLHCGLRAGEIFSLEWVDIDVSTGLIFIRDPKNKRNRQAFMTSEIKQMFSEFTDENKGLIFPAKSGEKRWEIPKLFKQVVDELGFNDGITDRRQRVVFHTCRHSYASWLVGSGVDLYKVKALMGHCTITQTERYSHLAPDTLQRAVQQLEDGIKQAQVSEQENVIHTDFS
ncbi:MAG: site-specific integrase [Deltaproteobacteria bacterium]|nr:site-specific integrase [Candidatus Tharpella sp.]